MARWLSHRSDANAEAVYKALEAAGAHVEKLGRPVDALIYFRGSWGCLVGRLTDCGVVATGAAGLDLGLPTWRQPVGTVLAEIKTAKGKTRSKAQAAFLKRYPGPVLLLRTTDDKRK